ncbi:MAG: polysaccharide biosynthesis/export family protein [Candidatus Symbiothrix sp.]|jgi:polysaccharide export outer membrane protein|nr:polysaccharide biosynthesis/export family protein [Candidatus Symbiothrix sp.]
MKLHSYRYLPFLFLSVLLFSCKAAREVRYLKYDEKTGATFHSVKEAAAVRIQPDDILAITVNKPGPATVVNDFNLPLQPSATTYGSTSVAYDMGLGRQTYLVAPDGTIQFPTLGRINVAGYTPQDLAYFFQDTLRNFIKDAPAIVTVRLMNFKISFSGEINSKGQMTIDKDNINILEAIAKAGDLTLYGKRDDIQLIRTYPDGTTEIHKIDISKADIIESPYYYLRQNDHIYVPPTFRRAYGASMSGTTVNWVITGLTTFLSVFSTSLYLYDRLK